MVGTGNGRAESEPWSPSRSSLGHLLTSPCSSYCPDGTCPAREDPAPLQASFTSLEAGALTINHSSARKPGSPLMLLVRSMWRHRTGETLPGRRPQTAQGTACGRAAPPSAPPVTSGSIVGRCPPRGLASAGAGTPCSVFLLREGLRGTTGPLRLQRPNGMQIGICSHKDILCMDFLLDFTWKLIIHHPGKACTTSGLCQQFLFI